MRGTIVRDTSHVKVTVVTPVHNGEPFLADCIEGVLAQTHQNFEYVIVNNASTDRSAEIAQDFGRRDERIRLVSNQQLLPQIANINYSLTLVSPDSHYCKCAYADDLLEPTAVQRMVEVAESDPAIAIVSAYESFGVPLGNRGIPYGQSVVEGRDACRLYLLEENLLFGSPNGLLFRAEDIRRRQPFFRPDEGYYEDVETCFDILKTKRLGFVHQVLTYTRRDNVSTISGIAPFSPHRMLELLMLHRHGEYFLTTEELSARWRERWHDYQRFLGQAVLKRRDTDFWRYHQRGLDKVGRKLTSTKLAWYAWCAWLDYALNPKASCEKVWQQWRRLRTT